MSLESMKNSKKSVDNSDAAKKNKIGIDNTARAAFMAIVAAATSGAALEGKTDASLAGGKREALRLMTDKKRLEKSTSEVSDSLTMHETPEGIRYTTEGVKEDKID